MSDNSHSSSGDRNSVRAADFSDKLKYNQRSYYDSSKLQHQKPPVTAPKPKPKPRKSLSDEDTVLKSFDDMLDREEEEGSAHVKKAASDHHSCTSPSTANVEDCIATVTVNEERMASPPPDYDNITDEEESVNENVASTEAVVSPVRVDSETSDYRSDSRGSIDDDVIHMASSVADQNRTSLTITCVSHDCSGKQV